MKTLNRPMFRYGGPIKEGIMDGMKDNPQQLVKSNADGSRPGYAGPAAPFILAGMGLNALRAGAMRMAPRAIQGVKNFFTTPVTKTVPKQGPSFNIPGGNVYSKGVPGGKMPGRTITPGSGQVTTSQLKPYFANDPLIATGGKIIQGLTSPTSKGLIQKGARFVLSPTGVVTGGYFIGGKFFNSDGTEIPADQAENLGLTAGDKIDEKVIKDQSGKSDGSTKRLNRDEEIEANRQRYYKLMGIDKMNKESVYDSLIDASKIIQQEGGDLKGAVKSGSLQSQLINAISKNLDKSSDLKKQIDAAILKGEITKDINKGKDALAAELTKKRIQVADKQLAGPTLNETRAAYQKSGEPLTGQNLYAEATRAGEDIKGILDTKTAGKFLTNNPTLTEADFVRQVQENRVKEGQPILPEGNYVVNGRIVHISSGGLVDKFIF